MLRERCLSSHACHPVIFIWFDLYNRNNNPYFTGLLKGLNGDIYNIYELFSYMSVGSEPWKANLNWNLMLQIVAESRLEFQFNKQLLSTAPLKLMAVQCWETCRGKPCWGWVSLPAQLRPTLCSPMHWSPSGSFVHGISQARILRPSSWIRVSCVSCIGGGFFTTLPPEARSWW